MKAPADGALIVNGESLRLWMTGVPVARCLGVSRRCVEGPYQDCSASGASVDQVFRIVPFRWLDPWDTSHSAAESGHQLAQPAGLGRHHRALAVLEAGRTSGDKGEAPAAPTHDGGLAGRASPWAHSVACRSRKSPSGATGLHRRAHPWRWASPRSPNSARAAGSATDAKPGQQVSTLAVLATHRGNDREAAIRSTF
jgi:hypothetical protein